MIRSLRNVRRRLSTCRNLDVTINLLQEKLERAGAGALHNAWDDLRQHTLKLRRNELARARKRLREVGIVEFIEENLRLLETCETANLPDLGNP